MLPYTPLVIIGAARSGTRLLRDLLASHPDINSVPYDINYAWRFGLEHVQHDAQPPDQLTKSDEKEIRDYISRFWSGGSFLVEKTVGNSLRVPYVQRVLPRARFIHLIRDGLDVTESAYRRWKGSPNWSTLIRKLLSYPVCRAPRYAIHYLRDTLHRIGTGRSQPPPIWGPRYPGVRKDLRNLDLLEVCARQWSYCVRTAITDFQELPNVDVHTVRYEALVTSPSEELRRMAHWLGINPTELISNADVNSVTSSNIGKGKRNLAVGQIRKIIPHVEIEQRSLGYSLPEQKE